MSKIKCLEKLLSKKIAGLPEEEQEKARIIALIAGIKAVDACSNCESKECKECQVQIAGIKLSEW